MSRTTVETTFTANAEPMKRAASDAAKHAKQTIGDVGKGIKLGLGGPLGEMTEKLGAVVGAGGPLALIAAGVASIVKIVKFAIQEVEDGFNAAIHNAKRFQREVDAMNARSAHGTAQLKEALKFLEANRDKPLTFSQMVDVGVYQKVLKRAGLGEYLPEDNINRKTRTFSFSSRGAELLRKEINSHELQAVNAEIAAVRKTINANKDLREMYENRESWTQNLFGLGDPEKQQQLSEENIDLLNRIMALEQKKQDLEEEGRLAYARAVTAERDQEEAAAKEQARLDAEQAERRKRMKEEEARNAAAAMKKETAARISSLELEQKGIAFLGGGGGQIFTNSLTQRGGFAGGARLSDGARFQNAILDHNRQQMIELKTIKQEIANLKTI